MTREEEQAIRDSLRTGIDDRHERRMPGLEEFTVTKTDHTPPKPEEAEERLYDWVWCFNPDHVAPVIDGWLIYDPRN